ncbi:MAG: DUF1549 domain-containing protein, partial [Planctomycetota bacterium]
MRSIVFHSHWLALVMLFIATPISHAGEPVAATTLVNAPASSATKSLQHAADQIDGAFETVWQQTGITPSQISGDAEFCRRLHLDVTGIAPTPWQVRKFLEDTSPNKRSTLIDQLLASPEHATHMATRWQQRLLPDDTQTDPLLFQQRLALHNWLRRQFRKNTRHDYLVGSFLTASGRQARGPSVFYSAHETQPEKLAAATSKIFLGISLDCAQCHDHPFDRWTQDDFWQFAAFFSQVRTREGMRQDAVRGTVQLTDDVNQVLQFPESDRVMTPMYPGVKEKPEPDPDNKRRRQLAIWLASRDNPYFARTAAGQVWHHLFGRQLMMPEELVEIVVDKAAAETPLGRVRSDVLNQLSQQLTEHRFDLRRLYAIILRSRTYARSSVPAKNATSPNNDRSFATMLVKTLSPEQIYDSMHRNILRSGTAVEVPEENFNPLVAQGIREQFIARLRSTDADAQEYPHGVVQA